MEEFLSSSLLTGGGLGIKEDVLAVQRDGTWYVLLRLTLAPHAVSLMAGQNAVKTIYSLTEDIKKQTPGLEFYFSGIPFHSYESSSSAQREISVISTVSLIIILIMFIYVFRSPLPVVYSFSAAIVSLSFAAAAALLVFRQIHIITFVFGTTLIGTCVDYSAHFFVHWKGNRSFKNGAEIRSHISKSVIMSFVSSEICFCVFLFAPFPILKQFAVFSMAGLLSSFLTCFCVYPRLKIPEDNKRRFEFFESKIFHRIKNLSMPRAVRPVLTAVLIIVVLTLFILNLSGIKIDNNLSSLYTMSDKLFESEKRAALVLNYGSNGWYFIVEGANTEETLINEEKLISRLEAEVLKGNITSFLGTSVFVPSIKRQKETYNAMKALLPLAEDQFENLGFPRSYAQSYKKEFESSERYCYPQEVPDISGISKLWIGENNGNCYSCVFPVNPLDEDAFSSIAAEIDHVYFINKAKDIGHDMDALTQTMLLFFIVAYIVVSALVCVIYPRPDSIKICAVPLLLILSALTIQALNKITLSFFSSAALILVLGLGLDYIFYMTGKKHEEGKHLTSLAVVVSFLTTLLSFGVLVLSSFMPTHIFGLTVSAGLIAAFIFAMLLQTRES